MRKQNLNIAICCALAQLARADDLPVDGKLAQNAVAVLRVRLFFSQDHGPGSQFTDYVVHTIRKFKNESNRPFQDITVWGGLKDDRVFRKKNARSTFNVTMS